MNILKPTLEDLVKSFITSGGENTGISFGRVQQLLDKYVHKDNQ